MVNIDHEALDKLYERYGYKVLKKNEHIRIYLYEEGRYYGADIIPLCEKEEVNEECKKIKTQYAEGGYAVQVKHYRNNEEAATELYKSFFSYDATKLRIKNKYNDFVKKQGKLNGSDRYSYINAPYEVNNEVPQNIDIITAIKNVVSKSSPQLIILEAAAGYGKTCTAYEVLKSLLDSNVCENPLFTELSRNRGANIFRYILLDEIDREYHSLDSILVNYEIQTGRIPLIIDGFDELLHKSDIVKSDRNQLFGEVETMLDTIGKLLKGKAKVILTTRKTAIFTGDSFIKWVERWNNSFEVTRFSIEVPKIKEWLGADKLKAIQSSNVPVEYISNPVLLTYLRNLEDIPFAAHVNEPETIVKKYFMSLLSREMDRQDLRISPDDQYDLFRKVVKMMIMFDQSAEKRSFLKEIIVDENKETLERALNLYPGETTIDNIADKLITHALLDRKGSGEDMIGFINEFVFGTFIGELMSETTSQDIESHYSAYMVEIGVTAYRVQNAENKELLWKKIEALSHRFENNVLFIFDITLMGRLMRSFEETIFQSISIFKINFTTKHTINSSVFINCKFKNCSFEVGCFHSISFIDCHFEDCKITNDKHLDDGENIYVIKCTQKGCEVLDFSSRSFSETDIKEDEKQENEILLELYKMEESNKSQRVIGLMKKYDKGKHKAVARIIDNLSTKRIISVSGSEIFIEMNRLREVKNRIGIK